MKTLKTPKGCHNRRHHGSWSIYGTKEEREANRRLFKAVRHKLLMCIPLNEEEEAFRQRYNIDENTKMSCTGYPLPSGWAHGKWIPNQIWKVSKYYERHFINRV